MIDLPSPTSNLSRQPTFENLTMLNSSKSHRTSPDLMSTSSSSSRCSCQCDNKMAISSTTKPHRNTPHLRAPLIGLRDATNKTSLGKTVGARAGWIERPSPPKPKKHDSSCHKHNHTRPQKLCSQRLRSARSLFDGFALTILKTGTVVLEKLSSCRTAIREIVQISADGESITVARLRLRNVVFSNVYPTTIDKLVRQGLTDVDVKTYHYETMPSHLFGRYRCAVNFVSISRAKTPKVIISKTIKGRSVNCSLMESLVDCVVTFSATNNADPNHHCTVTFMPNDMTRIQAGTAVLMLPANESGQDTRLFQMPKQISEMLSAARQMRLAAISVEKSVSSQLGSANFPVECGQMRATF